MTFNRMGAWILVLGCLSGFGCSRPVQHMNVTGTVKYNDKDVLVGQIFFEPDEATNPKGEKGFAVILNSKYDTSIEGGKQPSSGAYIVRIVGFGEPGPGFPGGKPLFQDYREKVTLPRAPTTQVDFYVQGPKEDD